MERSFTSRRSGGGPPRRPAAPATGWDDASRTIKRIAANVSRGAELDARAQQQLPSAAASMRAAAAAQQQQGDPHADLWATCTALWEASTHLFSKQEAAGAAEAKQASDKQIEALLQLAWGLLQLVGSPEHEQDGVELDKCALLLQMAQFWVEGGAMHRAESFFARARQLFGKQLELAASNVALPEAERAESAMLLFDVLSGSLMAAYELNQLGLASNLLASLQALYSSRWTPPGLALQMAVQVCSLQLEAAEAAAERDPKLPPTSQLRSATDSIAACLAHMQQLGGGDASSLAEGLQEGLQELLGLQQQALMRLAEAHMKLEEYPAAQALISRVDAAAQPRWASAAAVRCSLGLGEAEEAQQLIASLLADPSAGAAVTEALGAYAAFCIKQPASFQQLLQLALRALQAYPQEASIPMAFISQMLLGPAGDQGSPDQDRFILGFLGDAAVQELILQSDDVRAKCHGMLAAAAQQRYGSKAWQGAQAMLSAALFYAPTASSQARSARLLAMCLLHQGQHETALEYANVSHQHEPGSSCCSMIRCRALLALGRVQEARQELQELQGCADYHISHMQVLFQEASRQDGAAAFEVDTLSAWRQLLQCSGPLLPAAGAAFAAIQCPSPAELELLLKALHSCCQQGARLARDELPRCWGELEQLARWLAAGTCAGEVVPGWEGHQVALMRTLAAVCQQQGGVAAAQGEQPQLAFGLLRAASELHLALAAQQDAVAAVPSSGGLVQAAVQAACCAAFQFLEEQRQPCGGTALLDDCRRLVEGARRQLEADDAAGQGSWQATAPALRLLQLEFAVATYGRDQQQQKAALQAMAQHPGASVGAFSACGRLSSAAGKPWSSSSSNVACIAFGFALRVALQKELSPKEAEQAAGAVGALLRATSSNAVRLKVCERAVQLVQHLQQQGQAFPAAELQWLVSTCWNHSVSAADGSSALRYGQLALQMLQQQPREGDRRLEALLQRGLEPLQRKVQEAAAAAALEGGEPQQEQRSEAAVPAAAQQEQAQGRAAQEAAGSPAAPSSQPDDALLAAGPEQDPTAGAAAGAAAAAAAAMEVDEVVPATPESPAAAAAPTAAQPAQEQASPSELSRPSPPQQPGSSRLAGQPRRRAQAAEADDVMLLSVEDDGTQQPAVPFMRLPFTHLAAAASARPPAPAADQPALLAAGPATAPGPEPSAPAGQEVRLTQQLEGLQRALRQQDAGGSAELGADALQPSLAAAAAAAAAAGVAEEQHEEEIPATQVVCPDEAPSQPQMEHPAEQPAAAAAAAGADEGGAGSQGKGDQDQQRAEEADPQEGSAAAEQVPAAEELEQGEPGAAAQQDASTRPQPALLQPAVKALMQRFQPPRRRLPGAGQVGAAAVAVEPAAELRRPVFKRKLLTHVLGGDGSAAGENGVSDGEGGQQPERKKPRQASGAGAVARRQVVMSDSEPE